MHAGGVQPAFGGPLLAIFRHDAGGMRFVAQGDRQHLVGRRHFQIERDRERVHQHGQVIIADMATVFPKMSGYAIGTCCCRNQRRAHRFGVIAAAGVADGCDMVDIDAKPERVDDTHPAGVSARLPGLMAGMAASSGGSSSAA